MAELLFLYESCRTQLLPQFCLIRQEREITHDLKINSMLFLKENLEGNHYSWNNSGNNSTYTGMPSRRLFDRDNGDQVLFLINAYASETDSLSISEVHRIEKMIISELPMEAKSEISVFNWLKEIMNSVPA
jgi:hypothetical protein